LTEVGRRFERGDRPGAPIPRRKAAGECCTVGARGCAGRGYRLWPLLCGGLL